MNRMYCNTASKVTLTQIPHGYALMFTKNGFKLTNESGTKQPPELKKSQKAQGERRQEDLLDANDIHMQFNGTVPQQNTSNQIKKVEGSDLNDTPFGDDLISNDTEHRNAAIDLSGDSIQVDSGRNTATG